MVALDMNLLGQTVGHFEILAELGRGGMAIVYKARQTNLDRIVALKVLRPELARDTLYVARFRLEARSVARLEHPHIVPIYEVGEKDDLHFIAMQYIPGRTLRDLMQEQPALSIERVLGLLTQMSAALDYAHRCGIIHRDIKPSNVMLTETNWVYLTDFGLARAITAEKGLTAAGMVIGTPEYMSPEQAQGLPNIGPSTDTYALGVILYELLTGELPFEGETAVATLAARIMYDPKPPSHFRADLARPVEAVMLRALAREPTQRFQSATQLVTALQNATRSTLKPFRPTPPNFNFTPPPRQTSKRDPVIFYLGLAILMLLLIVTVIGVQLYAAKGTVSWPLPHPSATLASLPTSPPLNPSPLPLQAPDLSKLGWEALTAKKYVEAEQFFQQALLLNPRMELALTGLGMLRQEEDLCSEAEDFFKQALKINEAQSKAHNGLAWCLFKRGKEKDSKEEREIILWQAEEHFKRAIKLDAKDAAMAYYGLGWSQEVRGRLAEAKQNYELASDLAPNDSEIKQALLRAKLW